MPGLDPFYIALNSPADIQIVCIGDSTTFGTGTTNNLGWPGALRTLMTTRFGIGSNGLHDTDRNISFTTGGAAWTKATTSNAWDVSIANASGFSNQGVFLGADSTRIVTWTKPSYLTVDGFYIWVCDGAGSGNFSYSTDGGSNWTNVSTTWSQNNSIKRIKINSVITGTNTLKVRGANAAGTGINCYFIGLEPFTNKNTYTIHNVGSPGNNSANFIRTTSGNWHSMLDLLQPQLVIYMMTNDEALIEGLGGTDAESFRPLVQSLCTTVTGYGGSLLFINFFEQNSRSTSLQGIFRAMYKAVADEYGMPMIDMYELVGNFSTANALGYMNDNLHPSDAGALIIANEVWKVISKSSIGAKFRI